MGQIGRRRRVQIGLVEFGETRHAEQSQAPHHLVLQQFQHPHDAGFARSRKRPALQSADADEIGSHCDRLDDVGTAAERTVDHDPGTAGDGGDDFGQHLHGATAMVELTTAVI